MKNSFCIVYRGRETRIQPLTADKHNNDYYIAHLPGVSVKFEFTEDDEGAGHWLDTLTNNETSESREIGELIELYLVQNKLND